jgi:hypothetical protein
MITKLNVSKLTGLKYLNCSNTNITELKLNTNYLRTLKLYNTNITQLDYIPSSVKEINLLKEPENINQFPEKIKIFIEEQAKTNEDPTFEFIVKLNEMFMWEKLKNTFGVNKNNEIKIGAKFEETFYKMFNDINSKNPASNRNNMAANDEEEENNEEENDEEENDEDENDEEDIFKQIAKSMLEKSFDNYNLNTLTFAFQKEINDKSQTKAKAVDNLKTEIQDYLGKSNLPLVPREKMPTKGGKKSRKRKTFRKQKISRKRKTFRKH